MTTHESDPTNLATMTRLQEAPPTTRASSYRATVVQGLDLGKTILLDGANAAPVLVGQGPICEFRLSDPQVSRRHATLDVAKDKLRIVDLRSTNGTKVNGVWIVEALLSGGELVTMGETTLKVELVEEKTALPLPNEDSLGRIRGASPAMRRLYPLCKRLAESKVPVLIEGETGTGKELLAETLHEIGPRAGGPFVVFDGAGTPPHLAESLLFGHEKGAFPGADEARRGLFEEADGGTLFIDEVGELDPATQVKLLRAIERDEIRRVGGTTPIRVDVRVLASTRRDLDREVQLGRFRDDLFFRLTVGRIQLPPLRDRHGDVALLAWHFWNELGGGSEPPPELLRRLGGDRSWPGNVRELQNYVAQFLTIGSLPEYEVPSNGSSAEGTALTIDPELLDLPLTQARQHVLTLFERAYVARVLARHGGNVTRAAAASGIARRYFQLLRARSRKE